MQLYNSLTRRKELFTPFRPGKVSLYSCGITAYDLCHIGHARSSVVFDVLVRYLRSQGLEVTFIRNFTDVDDKIIARAAAEGIASEAVAERYIEAFYEDMDRLAVTRADVEPKATEHIPDMIALIETLVRKDKAYATASGNVYFRVRSFPEYGRLSGRSVDELRAGARVAPEEEKEDPLDFALWKSAKPGEPSWDSPWGKGRPGWHIECSAMSEKYAPLPLDIHGGGQDLIFPHHENEIAQSEAAKGKLFCRFWVHNGFVQVHSEKMSKSLGNFHTIRDILKAYLPEVLRFFLLTRQYRSPIDFTFEAMDEAEKNVRRIYDSLALAHSNLMTEQGSGAPLPPGMAEDFANLDKGCADAMADDLNTAAAIGHINNMVRLVNRLGEDKKARKGDTARELFAAFLRSIDHWGRILGLFSLVPELFLSDLKACRVSRKNLDVGRIEALVQKRLSARQAKDYAQADAARDELAALGVSVQDTPQGPVWDII